MKSSKESQCKGIQTDESVEVVDHDTRAGMGVCDTSILGRGKWAVAWPGLNA